MGTKEPERMTSEEVEDFKVAIDASTRITLRRMLPDLAKFDRARAEMEEAARGLVTADSLDLDKLKAFNEVCHELAHHAASLAKGKLQLESARTGEPPADEKDDDAVPPIIRKLFGLDD